jgi:hypothetical protein
MKLWQVYVVVLFCGWGLGAMTVWIVGDLAVRAEKKRLAEAAKQSIHNPVPWYLEENASAEQKHFLDRMRKGGN